MRPLENVTEHGKIWHVLWLSKHHKKQNDNEYKHEELWKPSGLMFADVHKPKERTS